MPEQNGYLFIGGPMDGVLRAIAFARESIELRLPVDGTYNRESYRKLHFDNQTAIYAHDSLTHTEATQALITGYKRADKPACPRCLGQGCRLCTKPAYGQAA